MDSIICIFWPVSYKFQPKLIRQKVLLHKYFKVKLVSVNIIESRVYSFTWLEQKMVPTINIQYLQIFYHTALYFFLSGLPVSIMNL